MFGTQFSTTNDGFQHGSLTVAGLGIGLGSKMVTSMLDQLILVAFGAATFGAGLTFFLM